MKKILVAFSAMAALVVPSLALDIDWTIDLWEGAFDEELWSGIVDETHEIVFLTGDDLRIVDGFVIGADDRGGSSSMFDSDEDFAAGIFEDNIPRQTDVSVLYVVAVRDKATGDARALASPESQVLIFENSGNPTGGQGTKGFSNDTYGDIYASTWTGNPWTGEEGGADPDPLPQPSISAFAVAGETASLVVSGAQAGAWYTVWRADSLGGSKTFVASSQATGETVSFELQATGSSGFFYVTGDYTEQTAADSWQ